MSSEGKILQEGPLFHMNGALPEATNQLEDLLKRSSEDEKCASLVRFDSNEKGDQDEADYTEEIGRLDYFINYAYGYGYEYFLMWNDVLDDMDACGKQRASLNVISLGCGSGIDFWSLRSALVLRKQLNRRRRLIGVDKANWSDCSIDFVKRYDSERGSRYRWHCDAAEYLKGVDAEADGALESNIIVFPKSIGELNMSAIEDIAESLAGMAKERELYLCICPAHGSVELWRNMEATVQKIQYILNEVAKAADAKLVACGESHKSDKYISELTPKDWLGHLDNKQEKGLPLDKVNRLKSCCVHASEGAECPWRRKHPDAKECRLEHSPISKGAYPCYRIYRIPKQA